jgi:hypothetical protein
MRSKLFASRSPNGSSLTHSPTAWLKRSSSLWRLSSAPRGGALYLLLLPWVALLLVGGAFSFWRGGHLQSLPPIIQDVPGGKQCWGWRQTFFCHPFA